MMRSKLYSLSPLGKNTPYVEILTSHIVRLSQEHGVKPGDLITDIVAQSIGKSYIIKGAKKSHDPFYSSSYKVNGSAQEALHFVTVLESLTGIENLRYCTMLPLQFLPSKGLLKSIQAWCPVCYQEGAEGNKEVFTPLVWQIKAVMVCSQHNIRLVEECPGCKHRIFHLSRNLCNGFCPRCGQWLGLLGGNARSPDYFELWVSEQVESLIKNAQTLSFESAKKNVLANLATLMASSGPNLHRELGVAKSSLSEWRGDNVPTFPYLLRICFYLKLPGLILWRPRKI